jgi:hypothetical protein
MYVLTVGRLFLEIQPFLEVEVEVEVELLCILGLNPLHLGCPNGVVTFYDATMLH